MANHIHLQMFPLELYRYKYHGIFSMNIFVHKMELPTAVDSQRLYFGKIFAYNNHLLIYTIQSGRSMSMVAGVTKN